MSPKVARAATRTPVRPRLCTWCWRSPRLPGLLCCEPCRFEVYGEKRRPLRGEPGWGRWYLARRGNRALQRRVAARGEDFGEYMSWVARQRPTKALMQRHVAQIRELLDANRKLAREAESLRAKVAAASRVPTAPEVSGPPAAPPPARPRAVAFVPREPADPARPWLVGPWKPRR